VGQGHIYYILSASAAGQKTVTFTPSGTFIHSQVAYWDFTPSPGCTFAHHTDYSLGSGTSAAINAPTFTPTAGDLLFTFGLAGSGTHVTSVNSPWACSAFLTTTSDSGDCTFQNTINAAGYILSATATSTHSDFSLTASNPWEALATSFTLSGASPPSAKVHQAVIF